jgi:hypothetical protein
MGLEGSGPPFVFSVTFCRISSLCSIMYSMVDQDNSITAPNIRQTFFVVIKLIYLSLYVILGCGYYSVIDIFDIWQDNY